MAIVLLVEDEEQVRVLAQSYLEEQGHQVLSAGTDGAIDLLFTDIELKDVIASGIELAQDAVVRWPNPKVLYTTGRDLTDGMKARFVQHSAFLPKPYTVEELLTTLSVHLRVSPQPRRKPNANPEPSPS
jgi:DNA-binding response OmpR family regulator